jgi:pimeloyl-ACP methyl ester carboxylesterase/predicted glycosyltransferase
VKIFYEAFGSGERTILLLPTWSIVHSRYWKMQVPYLSRHARVVTFDPRGNGRSGRPTGADAYTPDQHAADALAVMDAVGVERASLLALSTGARAALVLAAEHPERVDSLAFIGASVPIGPDDLSWFTEPAANDEGWNKFNAHYWRRDYDGFLEFFFSENFIEPHSSKLFEDAREWAHETTPETLIDTVIGWAVRFDEARVRLLSARLRCPVLVIHAREDRIIAFARGEALAEATGGSLVELEDAGHAAHARDPVRINLLLRDFYGLRPPTPRWRRAARRPKRALYVSSPIGLGHALRDVAIAEELRKLHPELQIDWLAQPPVTRVLEERGERIHPASRLLSSEVDHVDSEAGEHDLHVFQAWRAMDEIMLANFMVFHDLVEAEPYDLWIGDEAWELDHFLHENPELKRAPFVWMTDFVGWLPMPDGGDREKSLAADYNAEMIEHIERYPRLRDRSIFIGNPDDIVPYRFGTDLPLIRDWTIEHFAFSGYVTGFDPGEFGDRNSLRASLGYRPEEKVCIVTVGGSGAGHHLLRRVIESFPIARASVPGLRMIVVAGPRIDPKSLPSYDGMEVCAYVPSLYRNLAACDLAIVQGGLTTCMELAALGRPFLFFPLRHHFEQRFHVAHRLARYGAGRQMDYDSSPPEIIAAAIANHIDRPVRHMPVETDGAIRAASMIAELL